jgi:hypothetical protein
MKQFVFLLSIFLSTTVFAQTVERLNQNKAARIKERYSVLKSDTSIKEGKYEAWNLFDKELICEGYYKNNLKDSVWRYYSTGGFLLNTGKSGQHHARIPGH